MKSGRAGGLGPCLLVSLIMVSPDALAYLDPSTGSMILSAIVGMFATAALAVKTYWYKLKALFRRRESDAPGPGKDKPARESKPASD